MLKLALICGGPSLERGISLNSARSALDHLPSDLIELYPLYVDFNGGFHLLSKAQLYSNTPADFDFKLDHSAMLSEDRLVQFLKGMDLVFPVIHGRFGEDGFLQEFLEIHQIPFVGSTSKTCEKMFNKHLCGQILKTNGFFRLDSLTVEQEDVSWPDRIEAFFSTLKEKKAVIKPTKSGSSIGVFIVNSLEEALVKAQWIFEHNIDHEILVEPFCRGKEFTIMVFENEKGIPIALLPTEAELFDPENEFLDYRKKYLPSTHVFYHTPARFPQQVIEEIRRQAVEIFSLFQMRDYVRLDGWVLKDQRIYFSDINPSAGLEQNSHLFRQAALLGCTHTSTLQLIIKSACRRYQIPFSEKKQPVLETRRKKVAVLFGGDNSERQVSLMSGANVWLKLLSSDDYEPIPFFLDKKGIFWHLPYSAILHHSVEDIETFCKEMLLNEDRYKSSIEKLQQELLIPLKPLQLPIQYDLSSFLAFIKEKKAFLFICLHGDKGENGEFQAILEQEEIPFNGSSSTASFLCMDKALTGQKIIDAKIPHLSSLNKVTLYPQTIEIKSYEALWAALVEKLESSLLLIKPAKDGCSTGIVRLSSATDLQRYFHLIAQKATFIPPNTFQGQSQIIEFSPYAEAFLVEPYIQVDKIWIDKHQLYHHSIEGWIELTVGIIEEKGQYHSFSPSICLSEGVVLSVEEKFQGGTGINITPPPKQILTNEDVQLIQNLSEKTAAILGIENYARIDIFFNRNTKELIVIEANSLPALTPSTVIYHQALAENPPLYPKEMLEKIITLKATSLNPSSPIIDR